MTKKAKKRDTRELAEASKDLKLIQVRVPQHVYDRLTTYSLVDGDMHAGVYARRVLIDHVNRRQEGDV